jgi:hypothetical protein
VNGGVRNVIIFAEPFSCSAGDFIKGRFGQYFRPNLFFLVLVGSAQTASSIAFILSSAGKVMYIN